MEIVSKPRRSGLYTGDFDTLVPQNRSFLMVFDNMDTAYVNFFFEKKATLDNNYFFNNRQNCRIAFFSGGWHGGDRSPDQNTLNLHPHMGKAFVDMMVPPARYCPNPQGIICNGPP
jgi:hypothetical protein